MRDAVPRAAAALLLSVGLLTLYYLLALKFYSSGLFALWNVFFDADPNRYLAAFAHGWETPDWLHSIPTAVSLVVRAVAAVILRIWRVADATRLRELLGISVAPLAGAGYGVLVFRVARGFGIPGWGSLLLVLVVSTSVASVVFFTVPESYGLSALLALGTWALFLRTVRRHVRPHFGAWAGLAALAAGVTATNSIPCAILFGLAELGSGVRLPRAALRSAGLLLLAGAFAWGLGSGLRLAYRYGPGGWSQSPSGIVEAAAGFGGHFAAPNRLLRLGELAAIPARTIVSDAPRIVANEVASRQSRRLRYQFSYSGIRPATPLLALLSAGLVAAAVAVRWRPAMFPLRDHTARTAITASLAIGGYHGLLHLAFGKELFLYSMHFQPVVVVLIAIIASRFDRGRGRLALQGMGLLAVAVNLVVVVSMVTALTQSRL